MITVNNGAYISSIIESMLYVIQCILFEKLYACHTLARVGKIYDVTQIFIIYDIAGSPLYHLYCKC